MDVITIDGLENDVIREIKRYKSDDILLWISYVLNELRKPTSIAHRYLPKGLPHFVAAGIASFSVRYSNPYKNGPTLDWRTFSKIESLVTQFLLCDPIGFDKGIEEKFKESNPTFLVLRIIASQFEYHANPYASYSQPLILYNEAAKQAEKGSNLKFDFHSEFHKLIGGTLYDFLTICFLSFAASLSNQGFTRGYFEAARKQGLRVPDDKIVQVVLCNIAVTPQQFHETYNLRKNKDRRFRAYDFNPLFSYPLIRPWKDRHLIGMDSDRLIAPVPDLLCYRSSTGIYYQMYNSYLSNFSDWFGYVFETYVGIILQKSIAHSNLFSESLIKQTYRNGKVPDYVVIDGKTAFIIEAKATKFTRSILTIISDENIEETLKQVDKSFIQLNEFRSAILSKANGLDAFHNCTDVVPIVISYGSLYLINSPLFKDYLNKRLNELYRIDIPLWLILSIDELERLQPHLAAGMNLSEAVRIIIEKISFNNATTEIQRITGKNDMDSFLYERGADFFEEFTRHVKKLI
jgi:hypothetical protein